MKCYIHPDREAVGTCTSCGKPICGECAVEVQNKFVCRTCLSLGKSAPVSTTVRSPKDRSIALILEILPGLFGFLGFGWIYSGNTGTGIAWLIGVFVWDVIAVIIDIVTAGFGFCVSIPVNIILVAVSASSLNSYTKQHPELFGR